MCGEVRAAHVGERVLLQGWLHRSRDHGGLIFVDLRDRSGRVQIVFNPERAAEAHAAIADCRAEYVLEIEGEVSRRPPGTENPSLPTGEIEVLADDADGAEPLAAAAVLRRRRGRGRRAAAAALPLHRPAAAATMAENLVLRHKVIKYIRDFLDDEGFLEVETPILMKSTPEGARDYLVPSRLRPGEFYALPQSPQQFKQLLMVAGVDRYFQIARCFRDEDLRADRQPEFTQLDLEMSFVDQDDVLDVIERLFSSLTESLTDLKVDHAVPAPDLPRGDGPLRQRQAGPALRHADRRSLRDRRREQLRGVPLGRGRRRRGPRDRGARRGRYSRRQLAELEELAKSFGARRAGLGRVPGRRRAVVVRAQPGRGRARRDPRAAAEVTTATCCWWWPAQPTSRRTCSGGCAASLAQRLGSDRRRRGWSTPSSPSSPTSSATTTGGVTFVHHPFTMPCDEDIPLIETDPLARAGQGVRPRRQRLGARQRQHPNPPARDSGRRCSERSA